jgi:hypothetical protein
MASSPSGPKVRAKLKADKKKWKKDKVKERSEVMKDAAYAAKKGTGVYHRSERIADEGIKVPDGYSAELLSKEGSNLIGVKKKK